MEMQINVNTKIIYMDSAVPVMRAIENVKRDIRKVCCDSDEKGCDIVLIMENMQAEQFEIKCDNNMLVIYASDTLGFVYGLYHISRDILGVLPFWFWNDQVFIKKKGCRISGEYAYTSKPYQILVDYLDMWKDLMDCDAEPDPDEYTQIQSLGQEAGPVVTGDAAMLNENNNYASKMSSANPNLKVTIPPVSDINKKAIWNKPSYMLCISEKSKVKKEAAEFINWFINSEESNDIMMAERGVPSPQNIRDHLLDSGKLNEKQQEMFEYADQVVEYTGDTPDPDPMGISEVSKSLQDCAYSAFYGNITTKEAAEKFRKEANEILERNN